MTSVIPEYRVCVSNKLSYNCRISKAIHQDASRINSINRAIIL